MTEQKQQDTLSLTTADEFEAIADEADRQDRLIELINGEIVEKLPTPLHGVVAATLIIEIGIYLRQQNIGWLGTEVRHRSRGDNKHVFLPDVSVVLHSRNIPPAARGAMDGLPDLAVEIKSPTDDQPELHEKALYYVRNGTRLVWVILPESQTVRVYRAGSDEMAVLSTEDTLSGEDILPGFSVEIAALFPKP